MRKVILIGFLVVLVLLSACGEKTVQEEMKDQGLMINIFDDLPKSKKGVSDAVIAEDILNEGWCKYEFYGQQIDSAHEGIMEIQNIEIDKRMTDESTDEIWVIVTMVDEQFTKVSHLKLSYLNYTQGGWRLETIESYEPTKFLKNGEPQAEEMEYLVSCYFDGYSFEKVEGEATSYTCTFSIDEPHENCQYTGTVTADIELVSVDRTDTNPESCYWNHLFGIVDVNVDWNNACGIYVHEKALKELIWNDAQFELFTTNASEIVCSGMITDVTSIHSKDSYSGAQWSIYSSSSANCKLDWPGNEPMMQFETVVSDGRPFTSFEGYNEVSEKFIEANENNSQVVIEVYPDNVVCTYYLTHRGNYGTHIDRDGEKCEMTRIS